MKAWVLRDIDHLCFETVEKPSLADRETLVEVKATGICGSDIPRIYRTGAHVHPLIPGHEFSGIVVETGAGVDAAWKGRRVGVFPLIPCGECFPCRRKQYEMCRHYGYLGSRRDGGFAEYAAVPVQNLIPLPDAVSFEEAAMLEPMAVAVHAMRRMLPAASGKASDAADARTADAAAQGIGTTDTMARSTVAIYGLGTIGLLLLMFLMDACCLDMRKNTRIFAIGNKESQKEMCRRLGLPEDCYCDSRARDVGRWIMERTQGQGADVVFECVGKNETFAQAVENASPAGRICLVGNPYSDMGLGKEAYWKILRNQLTITGTWNSSFTHEAGDDWNYVLDRLSRRQIAPCQLISHRYPLKELNQGFRIMRDKTEDYVKIMGTL